MFKSLLLLLGLVTSLHAGCVAVDGDRIFGKDLANADPAFAVLNPDLYFSYAPAVGKQRNISSAELSSWAASNGLVYPPHGPVCFERAGYKITTAEVTAKIKDAFSAITANVNVEVIDICKCSLPPGKLSFPLSGAALPPLGHPDTPVLWRGQLISTSGLTYPIWARVRVLANMTLVRAKENIRAQQIIEGNQIEQTIVAESPLRYSGKQTAVAYIGKLATRSLLEGSYLNAQSVRLPSDVARGTVVHVDVIDGGTHLQLDARAESTGNIGDRVTLVNPSGLRRFQATITGPGHARIDLSTPGVLNQVTAENKEALVATTSRGVL